MLTITAWLCAELSLLGFAVGGVSLSGRLARSGKRFERSPRSGVTRRTSIGSTSFSVEVEAAKSFSYTLSDRQEMNGQQLFGGLGRLEPAALSFAGIFFGFALGLDGALLALGFFLLSKSVADGWFLIGVPAFFTALIAVLAISGTALPLSRRPARRF